MKFFSLFLTRNQAKHLCRFFKLYQHADRYLQDWHCHCHCCNQVSVNCVVLEKQICLGKGESFEVHKNSVISRGMHCKKLENRCIRLCKTYLYFGKASGLVCWHFTKGVLLHQDSHFYQLFSREVCFAVSLVLSCLLALATAVYQLQAAHTQLLF